MDEELGLKNDPSKTRNHTRNWCIQLVPNQNLAPEIWKWPLILLGRSTHPAVALDLGAAACGISVTVFFCHCLSTFAAHSDKDADNWVNSSERADIENARGGGWPIFGPRPKRLLVLSSTRVEKELFWRNRNRWRVLVPIFLSVLKYVCTIADRRHFKDAAGHRGEANDNNDFLHRTQTNRARHLTKRKQIQPAIFCRLHLSRFEKGKCDFSSSDPAGDFVWT
jgi:hypothetical protein